jgi:acetyl-CoA carboxylase biotin carboxyl carrier protein
LKTKAVEVFHFTTCDFMTCDSWWAKPLATAKLASLPPVSPGFRFGGFAVADDKRDAPRPFDVRTIEYLLKLMSEHGLNEITLQEGDQRIRLRRGTTATSLFHSTLPGTASTPPHTPAIPTAHAPALAPSAPPPSPPASPKNLIEIKSELVGTFYSKPDPKKPDFVTKGSKVTPKTVVCTIEAMKIYNEVHAGCSGTIVEVCKQSGDYVEFDQVLFRVDPS